MATTSDMAPNRPRKASTTASAAASEAKDAIKSTVSRARDEAREEQLEAQIARLQDDIKSIATTLSRLSGEKVAEARDTAKGEYRHLMQQGKDAIGAVGDQASDLETQLKDTIREKPLTAVAGAIGIGFLLAILSRR
ncbi:MAG TPA: DNA gyrase subunit B [Devosiaceae bacterium]|jgi:ElaB/YqjD/DUF883 family membrane-anchored ribosome-binding protein